ncbi:hypothetical protein QBC33DRAFT_615593 [Phialemonium atrogriseum]|uniref:Pentacotripeptide-repeat region of PRORP domain-containing protein n=1 Tax=Phialemonium atrogriseum TaxID=1093897 RepID=A0AAJ0FKR2_9PEZI|nr:uncharacterized protein QBC33DRAFT_615593 [Phialemonium atrogriseum]KAK1771342.1 hypothetical protein QBC33DRAFT_615593 [Phialemonium atrogriseum]
MQPRKVSLPAPSSVKIHQQLHTAFWAHGAAGIELFDACQALKGTAMESKTRPSSIGKRTDQRQGSMTASAFLLDFLYPDGAGALLRKLSPRVIDRYERPTHHPKNKVSRLHLTSSATSPSRHPSLRHESEGLSSQLPNAGSPDYSVEVSVAPDSTGPGGAPRGLDVVALMKDHHRYAEEENQYSKSDNLRELLTSDHGGTPDRVWHVYSHLDPTLKPDFRVDVLGHLAKSDRPVEAWRINELFSELDSDQWTEDIVNASIKANLTLNNTSSAIQLFTQAMDLRGMVQGLDLMLAYAFKVSSWTFALETWAIFRKEFPTELPTPINFEAATAIPNFSVKLSELYNYVQRQTSPGDPRGLKEQVDALLTYISTDSLGQFKPPDAVSILDRVGTYREYEEFINICMERGQKRLAARMYWRYRRLPNVRIRVFVLRHMLSVFYPHDAHGMEQVLKDWYQRYDHLDSFGYHKFLSFYAGRGDTKTVLRLLAEYKKHYPTAKKDRAALSALMHAYAVRGDVGNARHVLVSSSRNFGREPGTIEWNVLLNAHAKAWDFDGAINTFAEICEAGKADAYSFGTFMAMVGGRGDLHMCLDLHKTARQMGIEPDASMTDSLVEAYCQNDQFAEAEYLCARVTREKHVKGNYTVLWNTLLIHYAHRRDLASVNRILERMTNLDVAYDTRTYEHLLQALVYCRQSQHALQLIRVAQEERVFEPTLNHYLLLMSAFIRSREPHMALKVSEMIKHMDNAGTADRMTKVIEALGRWQQVPEKARKGKGAHHYLKAAFQAFHESLGREERTVRDDRRSVARQYSQMIFILTQMRDFASVKQIMAFYKKEFPRDASPQTLPLKLLNSIMLADFYENKFDRVKSTWNLILERTKRLGKPPATRSGEGPDAAPSRCYVLSDALKTMQRVYLAEKDADGLLKLVAHVREAGFELDSKNWNYHVQALARLKQWKEAFSICEDILMPQWTGWRRVRIRENVKNQLPLELRRLGNSPRYLRPISYTLLVLAREYMELEQMMPWSLEAANMFNTINENCARVVRAIKTMVRTGTREENQIFTDDPSYVEESEVEGTNDGAYNTRGVEDMLPANRKRSASIVPAELAAKTV